MKISCSIFCESMNNSAGHSPVTKQQVQKSVTRIGLGQIALHIVKNRIIPKDIIPAIRQLDTKFVIHIGLE